MSNLYLYLDLFTLLGPLLLSFDKKVGFYKHWKGLFLGIVLMMGIFIPWDIAFSHLGVWGFNDTYLCGVSLFGLPIEEWLFFIVVPYACIFIYACIDVYVSRDLFRRRYRLIYSILAGVFMAVAIFNTSNMYTFFTFLGAGLLIYAVLVSGKENYLSKFLLAYGVILIPFFLINGVLTGTGIEGEVVWYNNTENLGIRMLTIPIEDMVYNLLMLLIVMLPFQYFYQKK